MIKNPLLCIDSYKLGHMTMYPTGTEEVYCNLTPRSTRHFDKNAVPEYNDGLIVSYGVRLAMEDIQESFEMNFFNRPLKGVLAEFKEAVLPFVGDNSIEVLLANVTKLHKLGYLPLIVKWIPEGTLITAGTPMVTIRNTNGTDFAWLPNYLETYISSEIWKRATSATVARMYRKICEDYAIKTCDNSYHIPYQCHDFSCRGMSTMEDAIKTGTGHLTQFQGSDSIGSAHLIKNIYSSMALIACSVPATEHSVMCLGSSSETEVETFRRLIKQYNKGIISIVSDTWDFWDTITNKALELKDEILAREEDSLGLSKVVFRPDTGNPADVICGYTELKSLDVAENNWTNTYLYELNTESYVYKHNGKYYKVYFMNDGYDDSIAELIKDTEDEIPEAEVKGAIECLWDIFGGTVNNKGFKVLNPKVGLIYGDSITPQRAKDILQRLMDKGFAASNIVFGVGSYTYQYLTRDTLGFAVKATYAVIDGNGYNIFKAPKTDSGKNSAKGLLSIIEKDGVITTLQECTKEQEAQGLLEVGFINGEFVEIQPSWDDIRERAKN